MADMMRLGNSLLPAVLLVLHLPAFVLVTAFYFEIPGSGALLLVAPLLQALGAAVMLVAVMVAKAARENIVAWVISGAGAAAFVVTYFQVNAGF